MKNKEVYDNIINMLNENKFKFFLGGSRRFGYERPDSDFDIIIHKAAPVNLDIFTKIGVQIVEIEATYYPDADVLLKGENVHIIFVSSQHKFKSLRFMHDKIEKMLKDRPGIIEIVPILRENGFTGGDIFHLLYHLTYTNKAGHLLP